MLSRRTLANAIRALSMDAVQQANSGHPGMPMGMADIAEVLWNDFLRHNPENPNWTNRDRFILSNGHGSMLHYALLHLTGYDLSIDDLKQFRQLHSKTPGHPEFGYTPGVETTTGPLGQGLANAVGMAIAEKLLASRFNQPGYNIIDHYTYVFAGDGCLMEGISHEVCSYAGTLGLGKLIVFWDDNGISIDGEVSDWFSDDTPARFRSYNWQVIENVDGHNPEQIFQAITAARENQDQPTLICCKTIIGFGAPNAAGTAECHGSPLGAEEIAATRQQLDWPHAAFVIPKDIYQAWDARKCGIAREKACQEQFDKYKKAFPDLAHELERRLNGELPAIWPTALDKLLVEQAANQTAMATRKASQNVLNAISPMLPELLGGSSDLTGSNLTHWTGSIDITNNNFQGNYLHYGVREFGMSGIMNGIALHGGFIPYGGTFLVFHSYAANAVRMSALMKQRVIYVYTHDSIGLGEDGPTHQPIEQTASLRMTPRMHVWRPADLAETLVAWQSAIEYKQGPSSLLLSRQSLPALKHSANTLENIKKGGYILVDCENTPELILIATGSEVGIAVNAAHQLSQQGRQVRVVSIPCCEIFLAQAKSYQESVLSTECKARIAIEAAAKDYWYKFVGLEGKIIGLDRFGESAPAADLFKTFGFTAENIIAVAKELLLITNAI